MHRLFLMRHAAAQHQTTGTDHARPLTQEGRAEAARAAAQLPADARGLALVSSAVRTSQTVEAMQLPYEVRYLDELYDTDVSTMRRLVCEVDDGYDVTLVVAHNPTVAAFGHDLASHHPDGRKRLPDEDFSWFPTAAVAEFVVPGAWADLAHGGAQLVAVHRPR